MEGILAGAGSESARVATLFWATAAGAGIAWLVVIGVALLASRSDGARNSARWTAWLVVGGGVIWPSVSIAVLLVATLALMTDLRPAAGTLRIEIEGLRWWWRVAYRADTQKPVVLANEIRVPVGTPITFDLSSREVIHSFWIPALGGKMDMIPGRRTQLVLQPLRTGRFRGVCAEFCGSAHAQMAFEVEVMERPAFDLWLDDQATDGRVPVDAPAAEGARRFVGNGCGACHAIRGTSARGAIGPDLTHVGSRHSIGAATLPNDADALVRWMGHPARVKPGALMPSFAHVPEAERAAIAAYLRSLR